MATLYIPFDTSRISEGYGWAEWRNGVHDGVDFAVPAGTELRATASGVVRNNDAGSDGAGVDITTDDGWKVRMWHVSQFLVDNGAYVNAGDVVALSGGIPGTWGAGNTTGAHMHWGVKTGAGWVDPFSLGPINFGDAAPAATPVTGDVGALAAAVLRGDFGNGPARKAALGDRFDEVQAEVNRILGGGAPAPAPAAATNVVQPGDGYWHIAQRVWGGDNATIEANMNKLIELNGNKRLFAGDTVILDAPAPAPAPAPVEEIVQPTPEPVVEQPKEIDKVVETPAKKVRKKPVEKKLTAKEIAAIEKQQRDAFDAAKAYVPNDLGSIITDNKTRKVVWAIYGLIGLGILALGGGMTAAHWLAPEWFVFATGAYTALGPAFSSLAMANITTKK